MGQFYLIHRRSTSCWAPSPLINALPACMQTPHGEALSFSAAWRSPFLFHVVIPTQPSDSIQTPILIYLSSHFSRYPWFHSVTALRTLGSDVWGSLVCLPFQSVNSRTIIHPHALGANCSACTLIGPGQARQAAAPSPLPPFLIACPETQPSCGEEARATLGMRWPQPQLRSPGEATVLDQVKDNGDVSLGGSSGDDEKWLDSGLLLKGEATDFAPLS